MCSGIRAMRGNPTIHESQIQNNCVISCLYVARMQSGVWTLTRPNDSQGLNGMGQLIFKEQRAVCFWTSFYPTLQPYHTVNQRRVGADICALWWLRCRQITPTVCSGCVKSAFAWISYLHPVVLLLSPNTAWVTRKVVVVVVTERLLIVAKRGGKVASKITSNPCVIKCYVLDRLHTTGGFY